MKKILAILATIGLTSPLATVTACSKDPVVEKPDIPVVSEFDYGNIQELFKVVDLGDILVTPELTRPNVSLETVVKLVQKINNIKIDWNNLDVIISKNSAQISTNPNQTKYLGEAVTLNYKVVVEVSEAITSPNIGSVTNWTASNDVVLLYNSLTVLEKENILFHPDVNNNGSDHFEIKDNNQLDSFILVANNAGDYIGEIKIFYELTK
ncbi:hypothetical protein [Spiroplasma endosymbiont of Panorpa germanica]|uniref:hypothetical protein n=1 Tax=Spiroplasma endosymbiont of Panorpa germanica TaxID=3066314 RepID=UPI0030CD9511